MLRPLVPTLFLIAAACAAPDPRLDACRALLVEQNEAWNRGDLEGFVAGYHDSPETVFATADGTRVGYDAMVARYRERYPDAAAMGRLAFSDLVLTPLDDDEVAGRGRWRLQRADGDLGGAFVLVFRRVDGEWLVVMDYTTLDES